MKKVTGIFVLLVMMTVGSFAAVTFNPATGSGFVGKGDVQLAFSWNNAKLQLNASGVTFSYKSVQTYTITEIYATGNPANPWSLHSHTELVVSETEVSGAVNGDPRQTKGQSQFTGFNLSGFSGAPTVTGGPIPVEDNVTFRTVDYVAPNGTSGTFEMPVVNGVDLIGGNNRGIYSVELTSTSGGLYVNYGGSSVLIQ